MFTTAYPTISDAVDSKSEELLDFIGENQDSTGAGKFFYTCSPFFTPTSRWRPITVFSRKKKTKCLNNSIIGWIQINSLLLL